MHFIVFLTASCGGTHYLGPQDVLRLVSPGYPESYDTDLSCRWRIVGPTGHYLTFQFREMNLPRAINCSLTDYVQIEEANATSE